MKSNEINPPKICAGLPCTPQGATRRGSPRKDGIFIPECGQKLSVANGRSFEGSLWGVYLSCTFLYMRCFTDPRTEQATINRTRDRLKQCAVPACTENFVFTSSRFRELISAHSAVICFCGRLELR